MAIYRFSVQVISRRQGRSAVFAAAYRAGEKLLDERLGLTANYEAKRGIEHSEIIAPEEAPHWIYNRERLWNEVQNVERHCHARLAREVQFALPSELSREAQLELARSFIREQFVSQGMVADFSLHREDSENPHVHVMLTTRAIGQDGFEEKRRDWNRKTLLYEWREAWEHAANRALEKEGRPERIDCRSYADRGLDIEPQPKLFRQEQHLDRDARDHVKERAADLLQVRARNGAKLIATPLHAIELLTCSGKKPTFTLEEIERLADRHSSSTEQYHKLIAAVRACPDLAALGPDEHGVEHFSTQQLVQAESALLSDAGELAKTDAHAVEDEFVEQAIAQAKPTLGLSHDLTDEQAAAVRHVTRESDFAIVEGYAGTGKSTMLAAARLAWEAQGFTVVGGALAGKAADGLQDGAGIQSRTLASWQWNWDRNKLRLTNRHVLVIDEAGMVGTKQFAAITAEVKRAGAKLVVVGDTKQLQAIDPGAPMRMLQGRYGAATLSQIIRQRDHKWQRDATLAFAQERALEAIQLYEKHDRVIACASRESAHAAVVEAWDRDRRANRHDPKDTSIMLAFRRADVRALNEAARALRQAAGELGKDSTVATENGERKFATGDRIYFLRNDSTLEVKNGTLGTVESIDGARMIVRLDNQKQVVVDTRQYNQLDHGYAGTIHKSQGVTVARSYVYASRYMDASATYVAMSRHRADAKLFFNTQEFASFDELAKTLARSRIVKMAHEVLGGHNATPQDARESKRIGADAAFLKLEPTQQLAKLEALRLVGEARARSAASFLDALPELQQAKDVRARAASAHEEAALAVERFRQAHPVQAELGTKELRQLEARAAQLRAELTRADAALGAAQGDPALWAKARDLAQRHNLRIRSAQRRWRELQSLRLESDRASALERLARASNEKAGKQKYRAADERDRTRTFDLVTSRSVGDDNVLVLRPRDGGPLVLAYADHCDGESLRDVATQGRTPASLARTQRSNDRGDR